MNRTYSLFYSSTRKKKKCQLWGSVKTPKGFDNMKWTKKRTLDYLSKGYKIYVTSEWSVDRRLKDKLGVVLTNIQQLRYRGYTHGRPVLLTEELLESLPSHTQKTVCRQMDANLPCFQAIYNDRLLNYRRARDALVLENDN